MQEDPKPFGLLTAARQPGLQYRTMHASTPYPPQPRGRETESTQEWRQQFSLMFHEKKAS